MNIRDLPIKEMHQICAILDENNRFEMLGREHMQFDPTTMTIVRQKLNYGQSPSADLLDRWSYHNHTVSELFILLSRMKLYNAMDIIKKFVDEKYHYLIKIPKNPMELIEKINETHIRPKQEIVKPSEKILNNNNIINTRDDNLIGSEVQQNLLKPPVSPLPGVSKMTAVSSFVSHSIGSIPHISYEELRKATNNWDTKTILGRGGFGIVYKGTWKCTKVAIKLIKAKGDNPEGYNEQIKQSMTEIQYLNSYRHDNVVPLYGCSFGGPQPCLVYQYMSGGSLERRLHLPPDSQLAPLTWQKRLHIAIGTARGLQFLHTIGEKPLVHGDIKPANILLDPNDSPRIGDFGLAREGPQYSYIKLTSISGTKPYLPDEFLRLKKFSTKVDTFSFGIVLFEIATALMPHSTQREHPLLKNYVLKYKGNILDLMDKRAPDEGETIFKSLIEIGETCVHAVAENRPDMVTVLIDLEEVQKKSRKL